MTHGASHTMAATGSDEASRILQSGMIARAALVQRFISSASTVRSRARPHPRGGTKACHPQAWFGACGNSRSHGGSAAGAWMSSGSSAGSGGSHADYRLVDTLPTRCGGDVTDEMWDEIVKAAESVHGDMTGGILPVLEYLKKLKPLGELDWKLRDRHKPEWKCDVNCPDTLAICGKCFDSSVAGNIMFGAIMHILGLGLMAEGIGALAGLGVVPKDTPGSVCVKFDFWMQALYGLPEEVCFLPWPEHDRRAVVGGLGVKRKEDLCAIVDRDGLQPPRTEGCDNAPPCS